jgi:hypothetical protein
VSSLARLLWTACGTLSLACGAVGVVLPLLPTTPFLLLSAFAFARSSPRLHRWLVEHPQFGVLIDDWYRHGAINRSAKLCSVGFMMVTPPITWMIGAPGWALAIQIIILLGAAIFVVTRPEGAKSDKSTTSG